VGQTASHFPSRDGHLSNCTGLFFGIAAVAGNWLDETVAGEFIRWSRREFSVLRASAFRVSLME
jgi:hypothetical protein